MKHYIDLYLQTLFLILGIKNLIESHDWIGYIVNACGVTLFVVFLIGAIVDVVKLKWKKESI